MHLYAPMYDTVVKSMADKGASISHADGNPLSSSLHDMSYVHSSDETYQTRELTCSDTSIDEHYYAQQFQKGNYVRMGWLVKQGHIWKTWKSRFFVLFCDGILAYYKSKGKRKMKGCIQLNEGVVSIQHIDIRRSLKAYVFQVEKGYYHMWCAGTSQMDVEGWVTSLRSVRQGSSPLLCYEPQLTTNEEKAAYLAVTRFLDNVLVTDVQLGSKLHAFKNASRTQSITTAHNYITALERLIMDQYGDVLNQEAPMEMVCRNELLTILRRYLEDHVFTSLYAEVYLSLDHTETRIARTKLCKNMKTLVSKSQDVFQIPDDVSEISDWSEVIRIVNGLDCVSLPSHKLDVIGSAGIVIVNTITQHYGTSVEISDHILTCIFRYVLSQSSVNDMAVLWALLDPIYRRHPSCLNSVNLVCAFLDAIKWIEAYGETSTQEDVKVGMTLASSRVTISISTTEIGILFTADGYGRGAVVQSIRKQSQAALSTAIVPGLSLIAVNDTSVMGMPFQNVCRMLKHAALPKRLTFMTEYCYYQLLSLDQEMFQYLLCVAASRGDCNSIEWLMEHELNVNHRCTWHHRRGKSVFGFIPPLHSEIALHGAVENGLVEVIDLLLTKYHADPNQRDRKGRTSIHMIPSDRSRERIVKMITQLRDAGGKFDVMDRRGRTPIMTQAARGSIHGVKTLAAFGASLTKVSWSNGFTALEYACTAVACRQPSPVRNHNRQSSSTGDSSEDEVMPVRSSFSSSRALEIVEFLLSKGADPNNQTLDGDTSVHFAAANASSSVLAALVRAGGNVNTQNRFGQTPAMILFAMGYDKVDSSMLEQCLNVLVSAGADLELRDLLGRQVGHISHLHYNHECRASTVTSSSSLCGETDDEEILVSQFNEKLSFVNTVLEVDREALDLFGCTPQDYQADSFGESDRGPLRQLDARNIWRRRFASRSSTVAPISTSISFSGSSIPSSYRVSSPFHELFATILYEVNIQYSDIVGFILYLETFASLHSIIDHLEKHVSLPANLQGCGLVRFVVLLRYLRADRITSNVHQHLAMIVERHLETVSKSASLKEYQELYAKYFSLHGNVKCLEQYHTVAQMMHNRYGSPTSSLSPQEFPQHLHRQVNPLIWVEQCTLLSHALFTSIPLQEFIHQKGEKPHFNRAKRWFQHLSAYVINAVLMEETVDERVESIGFFLNAAEHCLWIRNYDTLAAILYALQSTAVQRLRKTLNSLSVESKMLLNQMQVLSDKGCREVNKIMHNATNPSMPYIGLYLQSLIGLQELPIFDCNDMINSYRLYKLGGLVSEILHRQSVAYALSFDEEINKMIHVDLVYETEEKRYERSLQLEPREAGALPLCGQPSVLVDDLDIENEVRESMGAEGTFGIRQWFRMQKVIQRNRSRTSAAQSMYEWV